MKSFFALAFVGAVSAATEAESAFMAYITEFNKSYTSVAEFEHRFAQFARNRDIVIAHNALPDVSFLLGFNMMSDWTEEEYKSILTYQPEELIANDGFDASANTAVPNAVNWVTAGAVTAIKNQGQCGSCWAFSSIASMESAHKIASGKLVSMSEQHLVDCNTSVNGCNGGNTGSSFNYFKTHYTMTEASYPYKAVQGTCKYNATTNTGVKCTGSTNVTANSAAALKTAVNRGPVSVAIEADKSVFQSYKSGIFNSTACGTNLDHATNVVGWGTANGVDYWLMRNSWGTTWGESGYMRIQIVDGVGICGIQKAANYPTTN
jgi:KDEL-tailed cysteine endopeptidase